MQPLWVLLIVLGVGFALGLLVARVRAELARGRTIEQEAALYAEEQEELAPIAVELCEELKTLAWECIAVRNQDLESAQAKLDILEQQERNFVVGVRFEDRPAEPVVRVNVDRLYEVRFFLGVYGPGFVCEGPDSAKHMLTRSIMAAVPRSEKA